MYGVLCTWVSVSPTGQFKSLCLEDCREHFRFQNNTDVRNVNESAAQDCRLKPDYDHVCRLNDSNHATSLTV